MASGAQRDELPVDGVRVTRTGGLRRDMVGLILICIGVVAAALLLRSGKPVARPAPEVMAAAPRDAAPAATPETSPGRAPATPENPPRTRAAKLRALRAAGIRPERGPDGKREIDAAPVIDALNAAGVHEGIAAFGRPGTDPPKSGVVVPEGFPLPEGYVRHHQSTDDGEALPPILMFHPDYEFFDEAGNKIAVPPDRIVPPDLVPPGIPLRTLDVPGRDRAR